MIREKVKITVTLKGQQFTKTVVIASDGSYDAVDHAVKSLVNHQWAAGTVQKISWNYV